MALRRGAPRAGQLQPPALLRAVGCGCVTIRRDQKPFKRFAPGLGAPAAPWDAHPRLAEGPPAFSLLHRGGGSLSESPRAESSRSPRMKRGGKSLVVLPVVPEGEARRLPEPAKEPPGSCCLQLTFTAQPLPCGTPGCCRLLLQEPPRPTYPTGAPSSHPTPPLHANPADPGPAGTVPTGAAGTRLAPLPPALGVAGRATIPAEPAPHSDPHFVPRGARSLSRTPPTACGAPRGCLSPCPLSPIPMSFCPPLSPLLCPEPSRSPSPNPSPRGEPPAPCRSLPGPQHRSGHRDCPRPLPAGPRSRSARTWPALPGRVAPGAGGPVPGEIGAGTGGEGGRGAVAVPVPQG